MSPIQANGGFCSVPRGSPRWGSPAMFGKASRDLEIMRWTWTLSLANDSAKMRGVHEEGTRDQSRKAILFP